LYAVNKIQILLKNGNGTFTHEKTYSIGNGSYPYSTAIADFNNDNNLDMITSNYGLGTVGIFFGYGDGTFTDVKTLLSGYNIYPKCVDVGDLNGDNIIDIIAADASSGLGIFTLLGYGNGSFQDPIWSWTRHDSVNCFTMADLNKDHRLDLVYSSTLFNEIGMLFGYGNGSFGDLIEYSTGRCAKPWFIAVGDLNNDSWLDIGVGNAYDSNIGVFLTLKNGTYTPQTTFYTGYGSVPYTLAFGDLNNDNQLDIVVGNADVGNIDIFLLNFVSTFAKETSYYTGSGPHPYSIVVSDLNNDNQQEMVVANSVTNEIEIFRDYNQGIFMSRVRYSTGFGSQPQYVTVADFNKDSQIDIAVAILGKIT